MKKCTKCKKSFPATLEYFHKYRDGLKSRCKTCANTQSRECNKKRIEEVNEYKRKHYQANKDKYIQRTKDWIKNNKEKVNEYYRNRRKTDPLYKLTANMRTGMSECLSGRKKKTKTFQYIGCHPSELKSHLEKQFVDGMSWDNYGDWHVDHIKPLCSFDLTIEENLYLAWNYNNLQPLWASDNCSKQGKF
jgi:hypothetical protein